MTFKEWIKRKIFKLIKVSDINPDEEERLSLVNDKENVRETKIREYNVWYEGDGDELLNFYTKESMMDYNFEPMYSRNKRNYFWSISSTETDIKRTHSGLPRAIIDTMVNIIGKPRISSGLELKKIDEVLERIIKENKFYELLRETQLPMTMVEGKGCYKIDWDLDESTVPIIEYYRANEVEYIKKRKRIVGIIFKDYYIDKKESKYLITETRHIENGNLYIDKELFRCMGEKWLKKIEFSEVEELEGTTEHLEIGNFNKFLAVPCKFYGDTVDDEDGRSVFKGRIDLFDDLDQCLSQSSNTVRKSTPKEYFNSDFLERDAKTGLPIQPKAYDRKYTMYTGARDGNGNVASGEPVQTTQPSLNFEQYNSESLAIVNKILIGILSPATLGIDIAKKDNAMSQREKEKVTIFSRNTIIDCEIEILKELFSQCLCAYEGMREDVISAKEYAISVTFDEFADDSFENKIRSLSVLYRERMISEDLFLEKLYGDTLSKEKREKEKNYLIAEKERMQQNPFGNPFEDFGDNEY